MVVSFRALLHCKTQRVELVAMGNGRIYIRPLPDETVAEDVAHVDWLAFTVTPPEPIGDHGDRSVLGCSSIDYQKYSSLAPLISFLNKRP